MKVELLSDEEAGLGNVSWRRPRCSSDTVSELYSTEALLRKPELRRCKHSALVRIDGKLLCKLHGGALVLRRAVEVGEF